VSECCYALITCRPRTTIICYRNVYYGLDAGTGQGGTERYAWHRDSLDNFMLR
jgi:hypothetical protein